MKIKRKEKRARIKGAAGKSGISVKIAALILFASFLLPLLPLPEITVHSAPEEDADEAPAAYVEKSRTNILPEGRFTVENYANEDFLTDDADYETAYRPMNGRTGINVRRRGGEGDFSVVLSKNYDEALDLGRYNELFFRVFGEATRGTDAADTAEKNILSISFTLYSPTGPYTASASVPSDGAVYDVYLPLDAFLSRGGIYRVEIQISSSENISASISAIFADSLFSYSHISRFSADRFAPDPKTEIYRDKIELTLSEQSSSLSAVFARPRVKSKNGEISSSGTYIAKLVLSGAENGTVTFSVKKNIDSEYYDAATLTISPGTNSYPFIFDAARGCDSYKVTLSGVALQNEDKVTVHSIGISYFSEAVFPDEQSDSLPGAITSCSLSQSSGEIRLNGTVNPDTVVSHINSRLGVFAADMWSDETFEIPSSVDMTTVFSITAKTDVLSGNPSLYRYFIAIVEDGEITPVTSAVYPSVAVSNAASGTSVLGLQSDDASSFFEANVSHTVVDVYLDRLLDNKNGSRIYSYGSSFFYLNNAYINELDSKVNFLIGCGANVCLRLLFSSPPKSAGEKDGSVFYSFDSSDRELSQKYMAAVDFLTSRYHESSGIIVGCRINSLVYNDSGINGGLIRYAENYANILRLTAVVIKQNISDASLIVPIGDNYIYGDGASEDGSRNIPDAVTGIGDAECDAALLAVLVSQYIAKNGGFQWYFMYECESEPASALAYAATLYSQLTQGSGTSPRADFVLWQPEGSVSEEEVAAFAEAAESASGALNAGAAILSVLRLDGDFDAVCDMLAGVGGSDGERVIHSFDAQNADRRALSGNVPLWDFRKSYSTQGFIFGGCASSLSTENLGSSQNSPDMYSDTPNVRALRCRTDTSLGNTAVMFCKFDTPKNLSKAAYVDLTLRIGEEAMQAGGVPINIPIKITFGKGVTRCEFDSLVTAGETVTLRCQTGVDEMDFSAEYIAVSAKCAENVTIDVSTVSAVSAYLSSEELSRAIERENTKDSRNSRTSMKVFPIVSACITVVVFALLSVIKSEPASKAEKTWIKGQKKKNTAAAPKKREEEYSPFRK